MEDASRELTLEELENVIGGAERKTFLEWAAKTFNSHLYRKEQNAKEIYKKRKRPGND